MKNILFTLYLIGCIAVTSVMAENKAASVFVDKDGVMRYAESDEALALFGVNYTTPFAHAYRAHKRLGVDLKAAIDADVYHMARLGLTAYRIHIWDREISDPEGNLVVNDHLEHFDYLLAQLKKRGIRIVLTPLQFGDAGYPEGGVPLDGFSSQYGKQGCLEDPSSWPLQENYLSQFVSHVNPYTELAYKNDPDIIAFEICNEPGHFEYDLTKTYINRMVKAIRDTDCPKPIFYNMSHGLPVFEAYLDAEVQGGTFQWYPANLVAGHEQRGNFLPYVDDYPIPFANHPKFRSKAKMVYEFDAADIGRSYIYPAIARTYRKAGMQFATMFAYDPIHIAAFNTEYQTHYMNLAYAPSKAVGLMVAAEAFRRVPQYADYGKYPDNLEFEGIRISYNEDLAELANDTQFLYSNNTKTLPAEPDKLTRIAGFGSSPLIHYPGTGAYFLDRLEPGVWRLEVMPDAIWVRDPYEKASPGKHVSRIAWNTWPITIDLPDLGTGYHLIGLNEGNSTEMTAQGKTVEIGPGAYLLIQQGLSTQWTSNDYSGNIRLGEFVAPPPSVDRTYVLHEPVIEAGDGSDLVLKATIVSDKPIEKVELLIDLPEPPPAAVESTESALRAQPGGGNAPGPGTTEFGPYRTVAMESADAFEYVATIPAKLLFPGEMRYHIVVKTADGCDTWPSGIDIHPKAWNFYGKSWDARIVAEKAPILLFEAVADHAEITADHRNVQYELVPSDRPGTDALQMRVNDLTETGHDHSFRYFFKNKVQHRTHALEAMKNLVVYGKSGNDALCVAQLALISNKGIAYGRVIELQPEYGQYSIALSKLKQVRSPNIPHGYPVFIPFWSSIDEQIPMEIDTVESVLISIGPGIPEDQYETPHLLEIERIWLD